MIRRGKVRKLVRLHVKGEEGNPSISSRRKTSFTSAREHGVFNARFRVLSSPVALLFRRCGLSVIT